ncbi:MAG: hypothetical protein ACD_72C00167G0002, partial [uncultured bacterium]
MSAPPTPLLVFLIGIAAGFVDSTIGSGGLISIPFLIFLGFPPQVAVATDRLGMVGQTLAGIFKFHQAKRIIWKYVPILTLVSLMGSLIGTKILLHINQALFEKIIALFIFLLLPLLFLNPKLGIKKLTTTKYRKIIGLLIYFLLMIFGGFFGAGA